MKKKITLLLSILGTLTLLLSACFKPSVFPEEYQVKNQEDETISAFGLNIAPSDEMGDRVTEWVSGLTEKEGFHYLICSDPDSWDVYLFYPRKWAETQMPKNNDVSVKYTDHILNVYVTEPPTEEPPTERNKKWVLHFMAPTFRAWPSEIRLYWNDREVPCDSMDISN